MEKRIDPITGEESMEPTTLKEVTESIIEMRRLLHQEALKREAERQKREEKWENERKERERKWAEKYEKLKAESQETKRALDKQMELFKDLFREFKDKTVYVAVAAIKFDGCSDIYAKKKGVFVLRCNGEAIFGLDNVPEERRRKF